MKRSIRPLCLLLVLLLGMLCVPSVALPAAALEERLGGIRLNLIALGDVGATLLLGLRLLGGDILASIGIFDVNENVVRRYELEKSVSSIHLHDGRIYGTSMYPESRIYVYELPPQEDSVHGSVARPGR